MTIMPEGPELYLNSHFVSRVCKDRVFSGGVVKSEVSKCCDLAYTSPRYTITSQARGKEVALTLQCLVNPENRARLLFRFGMSGKFSFGCASDPPKHSHLKFFTDEKPPKVLSFVDVRRFGSWRLKPEGWGGERGPDPIFEHEDFRQNVLESLDDSAFNRPICEALLNQKYFNGVGNYLRAEILFRAGIPPFTCARKVLEPLGASTASPPDLLQLCHDVPLEVINLKVGLNKAVDSVVTVDDYREFVRWLRCYENPDMRNMRDHNNRTIWFKGEAGPMVPKKQKSRTVRRMRPVMVEVKVEEEEVEEDEATNTAEGSAQAESKYGLKEGSLKERGKKSNKRPRKSSSEENPTSQQPLQKRRRTSSVNPTDKKLGTNGSTNPTDKKLGTNDGVNPTAPATGRPSLPLRRSTRIKACRSTQTK